MSILVGTASWTDKTLIACKRFYPRWCNSAEARLRHYASLFPMVEIDSSYYAMPSPATAQRWAERTPAQFVMNVKAFRLFTGHQTATTALPQDLQQALGARGSTLFYRSTPVEIREELWRRFRELLAPLRNSGRLGMVHFQYPPWVTCGRDGRAHVEACVEHMAGHQLSVEFRHETWFSGSERDATLTFERDLGVVHTVVDGPQGFSNSVPTVWEVTHPERALVRLHGRNAETWNIRGATAASDRFNYDYSQKELASVAADIRHRLPAAIQTHVVFNNNQEDQGQRNALTLMDSLELSEAAGSTQVQRPRSHEVTENLSAQAQLF